MIENEIPEANVVSSFALESLLWNIPNESYLKYKDHRKVFMFDLLLNILKSDLHSISSYFEANGIKLLCPTQYDIENMKSFINALIDFYEYE